MTLSIEAGIVYNAFMVKQETKLVKKNSLRTILLAQLGRSPELTKLVILLLVLGHIRARPGYTIAETPVPKKIAPQGQGPKQKGFTIKRPRSRFL